MKTIIVGLFLFLNISNASNLASCKSEIRQQKNTLEQGCRVKCKYSMSRGHVTYTCVPTEKVTARYRVDVSRTGSCKLIASRMTGIGRCE